MLLLLTFFSHVVCLVLVSAWFGRSISITRRENKRIQNCMGLNRVNRMRGKLTILKENSIPKVRLHVIVGGYMSLLHLV